MQIAGKLFFSIWLTFLIVVAAARAETVAFVNVNVIPMTSEIVLPAKTVMVTGKNIVLVGDVNSTPIPEGVLVVDGTDRFLMPGLAEMHGHIPAAGSDLLERVLHLYVANGITLVRGMLGRTSHLQLRQQILDGDVLGPQLVTSGPSFNGRSVSSPQQAGELVKNQHAAGYDFIKIHPGLTREEFQAIAETANALNMPFAGHVPAGVGVRSALAAGIASIDHLDGYMQALIPAHEDPSGGFEGFFGLLLANQADENKIASVIEATCRASVWNVPTQSLFENMVSGEQAEAMSERPEMRFMPESTVQQWVNSKNSLVLDSGYELAMANHAISLRRNIIKGLHDHGCGLLLGSDSPQVFNVPGFAIHRELQILVDAGLTPYEALLTGTVNPARFFGRAEVSGTIAAGSVADLVLLDANPLEDISATRRVHGVMLRGRWISQTEIRQLLDLLKR